MTPDRRVFVVTAALVLSTVALCVGVARGHPVLDADATWWQLALAFVVAERAVAHVEIRQQAHTLSLSEAVLFAGLMLLDPISLVAARVLGAVVTMAMRRLSVLKAAFNVALFAFEAALAAFLFHGAFQVITNGPLAWAAGGVAVFAAVLAGGCIVAAVISFYDQTRPAGLLGNVIRVQGLTALGSTSLAVVGAAAIAYAWTSVAYIGVLLWGALALLRRQAATTQRASNLESIGRYTAQLVGLSGASEVVDTSLREAAQIMRASHAALVTRSGGPLVTRTYHLATEQIEPSAPAALMDLLTTVAEATMLRDASGTAAVDAPDGFVAPLDIDGDPAVVVVWERSTTVGGFAPDGLALFASLIAQTQVALDRALLMDRLEHDAHHDALSGLPNRMGFAVSVDLPQQSGVLLIMDLDRFKEINDTLGHPTGDRALQIIASRLQRTVPGEALLARLGGDEFAVFDPACADVEAASALAGRLLDAVAEPIAVDDLTLHVGLSVGIALIPRDGDNLTTLMSRADSAMYEAKRRQSGWHFYSHDDDNNNPRKLELASSLRRAIKDREIEVWYQPKIRLDDRTVIGAEALARWEHPRHGFVPPDEFISIAERAGMMRELTDAVLEAVIADAGRWERYGQRLQVAVNLSTRNLLDDLLPTRVEDMVRSGGISADLLSFEITETAIMLDRDRVTGLLAELHAMGFSIAVDDYGTGYSSLAYLRDLPVDQLKIDRAFVGNLDIDDANELIVRSTIDLGHNLGLAVTAEGIEREAELATLRSLGCDYVQGYLISRPLPAGKFEAWLAAQRIEQPVRDDTDTVAERL